MDELLNEMLADLPPEKAPDSNGPEKNDSDFSEALLILFEFFGHDGRLGNLKKSLSKNIHDYLCTCDKPKGSGARGNHIREICGQAADLLSFDANADFFSTPLAMRALKKAEQSPYLFESRWLVNVPQLLPEKGEVGEGMIQCLPYLLTCYTENAPGNKIDPFDSEQKTAGWNDVFGPAKKRIIGEGNRARTIKMLCKYFTELPGDISWNGLLDSGEGDLYDSTGSVDATEMDEESSCHDGVFYLKESPDWKKATQKSKMYAICWEAYRRFAAFCEACKDVEEINLTLSMALFANGLRIHPRPESAERNSWDLISRDLLREEILAVAKRYDENESIQGVHQRAQLARFQYLICKNKMA